MEMLSLIRHVRLLELGTWRYNLFLAERVRFTIFIYSTTVGRGVYKYNWNEGVTFFPPSLQLSKSAHMRVSNIIERTVEILVGSNTSHSIKIFY